MGEGDQGRRRETGRLGTLVDSGFPFGLKTAKTTPRGLANAVCAPDLTI
jgi:hypothetical protein